MATQNITLTFSETFLSVVRQLRAIKCIYGLQTLSSLSPRGPQRLSPQTMYSSYIQQQLTRGIDQNDAVTDNTTKGTLKTQLQF